TRANEETLDRESLSYPNKNQDTHKEAEDTTSAHTAESEMQTQRGIILLVDAPTGQ
ncbi:orofacial cleft 1 candidate protein 1 isoform X1, partial [Sigmodon hispidus]